MKKLIIFIVLLSSAAFGQYNLIDANQPDPYNLQMPLLFQNWEYLLNAVGGPNAPSRVYSTSAYGGDVDDTIEAAQLVDQAIIYINNAGGTAILSESKTLRATDVLINDPNCYITKTGSPTLTLNGALELTGQAFDTDLTFAGNPRVNELYVENFGGTGDGSDDDTVSFQATLTACKELNGIPIQLIPGHVYKITATLNISAGAQLYGIDNVPQSNAFADAWVPQIYHDPTIANSDLFNEVPDAFTQVYGIGIRGIAFKSQTDGTAGKCFVLDKPGTLLVEKCFFLYFESAISISRGISNRIQSCFIGGSSGVSANGVEIRDEGTGVTTTTWIDDCYFSGWEWASVLEFANTTNYTNCVFETCSAGGIDIYQKCGPTNFVTCYAEDVPSAGIAAPIIQIGVNGLPCFIAKRPSRT